MISELLLTSAVILIYVYLKWTFSYWERKGFPYVGASIPFGALDTIRRGKRSMGMAIYDMHIASKEPVVGIYLALRPALLIRDPQLAYDIMTKDFSNFHDRGVHVDEENDSVSASLFFLKHSSWKTIRAKMTPSFTSGKLKTMISTSEAIADKMIDHLDSLLPNKGSLEIEMRKVTKTYVIDILAATIFGLSVDSFADPDNDFMKISRLVNRPIFKDILRGTTSFLCPNWEKLFIRFGWMQDGPVAMSQFVKQIVADRKEQKITRKDFLQSMIQLLKSRNNIGNDITSEDIIKSFSMDMISAQMYILLVAGFETTSSMIAFTLYELMQNPEVLARAQEDVRDKLEKHNGKYTYDAIQDMKYLELCVLETARKYPALPILNRECTETYKIPNRDLTIEKGTPIVISLMGIHRDKEFFPDPMRYHPERYTDEYRNYNPAAFMPFGEGPRQCIGYRMGKLNAKMAVAKILSHFNIVEINQKQEIEFIITGLLPIAKGGIPVRFSKKIN